MSQPGSPAASPEDDNTPGDTNNDPVDLIAEAIVGVPGVHDLHAGVLGEVATYLPGRRVNGVRMRDPGCEVHVVLDWGVSIAATSDLVRQAVRAFVSGPVDVTVEDIAPPMAAPEPASAS